MLSTPADQPHTITVSTCASYRLIWSLLLSVQMQLQAGVQAVIRTMCPLHHIISAELTTHTSVSRQGCSPWHGLCIALSSNSMLSFYAAVFYCRRIFKSHLLSDTQSKSLKGRKTIHGNGFSSFHAELWGRFSTFCGAAVFREAKGLVQFLWLILGLNLILQSCTGLGCLSCIYCQGQKGLAL